MPPGRGGSNRETEALAVVPAAAGDVAAVEPPLQPASMIVPVNARDPPTETVWKTSSLHAFHNAVDPRHYLSPDDRVAIDVGFTCELPSGRIRVEPLGEMYVLIRRSSTFRKVNRSPFKVKAQGLAYANWLQRQRETAPPCSRRDARRGRPAR